MVALQTLKSTTPLVIQLSGGLASDAFKLLHRKECTQVWQNFGPQTRSQTATELYLLYMCSLYVWGLFMVFPKTDFLI